MLVKKKVMEMGGGGGGGVRMARSTTIDLVFDREEVGLYPG